MKIASDTRIILQVFLALTLFDAIVNGAMTAALRSDGWSRADQQATNAYQFGFFLVIAALVSTLFAKEAHRLAISTVVLLAGYVEDTVYYVFVQILGPIIKLLSGNPVNEEFFPEKISGWIGWFDRLIFNGGFSLAFPKVIAVNVIAIAATFIILKKKSLNQNVRERNAKITLDGAGQTSSARAAKS